MARAARGFGEEKDEDLQAQAERFERMAQRVRRRDLAGRLLELARQCRDRIAARARKP